MRDNDWYFHNISEEIIYGPISHENWWIDTSRRIKKGAVIRKLAKDIRVDIFSLPTVLAKSVERYRHDNATNIKGHFNENE